MRPHPVPVSEGYSWSDIIHANTVHHKTTALIHLAVFPSNDPLAQEN